MPKERIGPGRAMLASTMWKTPLGLEDQYVEFAMAIALLGDLNRTPEAGPMLTAVGEVLTVLVEQGLTAAGRAFHSHPGLQSVPARFPVLWGAEETRNGKTTASMLLVEPRRREPMYPLFLWCVLVHPRVALRVRICPDPKCQEFFFDTTRNRSKLYCSNRCRSRATSREYRAAGKEQDERAERRKARVTSQPAKRTRR